MKKILVPCDFSAPSVSAYRVALDIANISGGEIHLVNVIELPVLHDTVLMPVLSFEEALLQELKEKAEKQFEKLKKKYAGDFDDIVPSVLYGNRSEEHTSELQSRENLVCRLLLEKKKKKHQCLCVCRCD